MLPSVVIIGAGNMAFHLVRTFIDGGVSVKQVYNRSNRGLLKIASMTRVPVTTHLSNLDLSADIYLVAISDDSIQLVLRQLAILVDRKKVIAHTSGNCTINVFAPYFDNFGAFYPLQSLTKERSVHFGQVPIFISSNTDHASDQLSLIAGKISERVIPISDMDRSKLHVPAVIVNNFVNHLFTVAYEFCRKEGIAFEHLYPLIQETIDRLKEGTDPRIFQTGPAIRRDNKTLINHRKMLRPYSEIHKLYNYISRHIQKFHENNQ